MSSPASKRRQPEQPPPGGQPPPGLHPYQGHPTMIRLRGNAATLADIRNLLAVVTDPELRALLEACLRMRGVA